MKNKLQWKKYEGSEDDFQKSVANYLDSLGVLWNHSAGERKTKMRQDKNGRWFTPEGNKLKAKGVKSGMPDIMIYEGDIYYRGLAIELKVGYNKPNENQFRWLEQLQKRKWECHWSNSMDEVLFIIETYLDGINFKK